MSVAICPKCQAQLKDDYGMVTCAKCEAIVFVDMDGIAHVGTETPQSDSAIFIPEDPAPLAEAAVETPSQSEMFEAPMQDSAAAADFAEPAFTVEDPGSAGLAPQPLDLPSEAREENPPEEFSLDSMLGFGETPTTDAVLPMADEALGQPGDPLGINQFANSDLSQAKDGLLVFHIDISGIDSKEIRDSLREAMEDSRFGWDTSELLARINKGHLRLETIPAVKAAILVNRIKRLPVEVRWEQHAITQLEEGGFS